MLAQGTLEVVVWYRQSVDLEKAYDWVSQDIL